MKNSFEKLKIGVIGLTENAGSAFIASYLARTLGGIKDLRPALVELKDSGLYDGLALAKHFSERDYYSFFEAVKEGESIRGKKNLLQGINWACQLPKDRQIPLSIPEQLRIVNNISARLVVSILPNETQINRDSPVRDMEVILLVIDPLPSKLLAGHNFLCDIKSLDIPVIYLVNKMNKGVSKPELTNYLKEKRLHYIPFLDGEDIYSAEYSGRQLYDLPKTKIILDPIFKNLAQDIFEYL